MASQIHVDSCAAQRPSSADSKMRSVLLVGWSGLLRGGVAKLPSIQTHPENLRSSLSRPRTLDPLLNIRCVANLFAPVTPALRSRIHNDRGPTTDRLMPIGTVEKIGLSEISLGPFAASHPAERES
jgi:hypothetical protein